MVRIQIKLPDGVVKVAEVTMTTTLFELLTSVGAPTEGVVVFNNGDTPMPDLSKTMIEYNNWCVEKDFIGGIYLMWLKDALSSPQDD